jgi:hypothetical protein
MASQIVTKPSSPSIMQDWISQRQQILSEELEPKVQELNQKIMQQHDHSKTSFRQIYADICQIQQVIQSFESETTIEQEKFRSKESQNMDPLQELHLATDRSLDTISHLIKKIEELSHERLKSRYMPLAKTLLTKGKGAVLETLGEKAFIPDYIVMEFKQVQELAFHKEQLKLAHEKQMNELKQQEAQLKSNLEEDRNAYAKEITAMDQAFQKRLDSCLSAFAEQKRHLEAQIKAKRRDYEIAQQAIGQSQLAEIEKAAQEIEKLEVQYQQIEQAYLQAKLEVQHHYKMLKEDLQSVENQLECMYDHMISNTSTVIPAIPSYLKNRQQLLMKVCYIEKGGYQIPYMRLFVYFSSINPSQFLLSGMITDPLEITKLTIPPQKIRGIKNPIPEIELVKIKSPDLWNILQDETSSAGKFFLLFKEN